MPQASVHRSICGGCSSHAVLIVWLLRVPPTVSVPQVCNKLQHPWGWVVSNNNVTIDAMTKPLYVEWMVSAVMDGLSSNTGLVKNRR